MNLPQTYAYLKRFKDILQKRAAFRKYFCTEVEEPQTGRKLLVPKAPFYSMYNIGPYTFAPFKVVWREVSLELRVAVSEEIEDKHLGARTIIPDHTLIFIPFERREEAHYACAVLNSSPSQLIVKAYVALHPSPHVLEHISLPKYDPDNSLHQELASLSQRAHELAASGQPIERIKPIEEEIDEKAAQLWGLTDEELAEIRRSLEELR